MSSLQKARNDLMHAGKTAAFVGAPSGAVFDGQVPSSKLAVLDPIGMIPQMHYNPIQHGGDLHSPISSDPD